MQKLLRTLLTVSLLSGCMDAAPDADDAPGTHEGDHPIAQEVELQSATYDGFTLAAFAGKELFRGIVLADGPVAQNIPSIRDHLALENHLHDPAALKNARELHARLLEIIERDHPQLFGDFEQAILSGDHVEISEAINHGRAAARNALDEAQTDTTLATDEKCVLAVVVVAALAAHVAVAVNHVLAHDTVWVSGVTTGDNGDELSVGGQSQSLLVSELADDVASKTKVPVWEFSSPTSWTTTMAYTEKTRHQLYIGDFDGDGQKDDRFYYAPGGTRDDLISIDSGDFAFNFAATAQPHVGDFDGDKVDDILFYEPGKASHYIWFFKKTTKAASYAFIKYVGSSKNIAASTSTRPVVGDFDGNGRTDILWYAPGKGAEYIWRFNTDRAYSSIRATAVDDDSYKPIAGDFVGDNADDVLWYCPGDCKDPMWKFSAGSFVPKGLAFTVKGSTYKPFVFDFDANGKDDIVWYAPGDASDVMWHWKSGDKYSAYSFNAGGSFDPAVGNIGDNKYPTIFWWPNR